MQMEPKTEKHLFLWDGNGSRSRSGKSHSQGLCKVSTQSAEKQSPAQVWTLYTSSCYDISESHTLAIKGLGFKLLGAQYWTTHC